MLRSVLENGNVVLAHNKEDMPDTCVISIYSWYDVSYQYSSCTGSFMKGGSRMDTELYCRIIKHSEYGRNSVHVDLQLH